jgi:hypothetical protein
MPGAVRYARVNGAHNVATTWDGSTTVPSAGDTVYMNALTVTGYAADFDLATGAPDVNAGSFVVGVWYVIKTVGSTTWTSIGALNNTVGTGFFATGAGTGSGVATAVGCITNRSLASPAITAGGAFACGDGRTLKATVYGSDISIGATVTYTGYTSTTITGDIYPTTGTPGTVRVSGGVNSTLIINGNIKANQSAATGYGVVITTSLISFILNGNIEPPSTINSVGLNCSNVFNVTINGTITGGAATGAVGAAITASGTVTIMGPLVGGIPTAPSITGGSVGTNAYGLNLSNTTCTATVTIGSASLPGTITGGTSSGSAGVLTTSGATPEVTIWANLIGGVSATAVNIASSAKTIVNGNVTAGTGSGGNGFSSSAPVVPIVINGNVTGSASATSNSGININSYVNLTVNGNVTGGAFTGSLGISDTSSSYVKINGDVTPGSGSASYGYQISGSSTVAVVTGTCYASNITAGNATHGLLITNTATAYVNKAVGCNLGLSNTSIILNYGAAMNSTAGGRIFVRKTQQGTGGSPATSGNIYRWTDNVGYTDEDALYTSGGVNYATLKNKFGDSSYVPPAANKTRSGTAFAFGDMTGTLSIPSANSVRAGVSLDATAGVAVVSASDVWKLSNTTTASSGGLLQLIKTTSTPEIAAAATTSFEP